MTEELAGGAAAPAEAPAIAETPAVETSAPEPTPRGAIDRAFEAVEAMDNEPADKGSETDSERARNPDGTFAARKADETAAEAEKTEQPKEEAPKQETAEDDAPSRFSPDAKAAWKDAPASIKAETKRALAELEQGIEKYRGDAQAFDSVREYDAMAKQYGTDLKSALDRYVAMDRALNDDPINGLALICQDKGLDIRQVAAHVLGKELPPAEQQASDQQRIINELLQEVRNLKQGVTSIQTGTVQQNVTGQIEQFANGLSEADRALFEELDAQIADQIGKGASLQDAFQAAKEAERIRVERISGHFGLKPQAPAPAVQPNIPDPAAQTRKGQLSVTGAPGTGSNPDSRVAPSSSREALDRAFAAVGL